MSTSNLFYNIDNTKHDIKRYKQHNEIFYDVLAEDRISLTPTFHTFHQGIQEQKTVLQKTKETFLQFAQSIIQALQNQALFRPEPDYNTTITQQH